MALEAGTFGVEGLMRSRKKTNWLMPIFVGGALGAIGWFTYKSLGGKDPWADSLAPAAGTQVNPMAGLGFAGLGCGCTQVRGY